MQKSKLQFKIQNYLFIISAVFALMPMVVFAAETSFEVKNSDIRVGDKFEAGFFLNTEDEDINAIEGKIIFPEKILKLKEIRDGNSIINFWIERPKAKNGEILFSGIIPGGYMDKKGLIFSVVFQALQEGRGSIEIRNIKVLLNDGKGTAANATISNLQFSISKKLLDSNSYFLDSKEDTNPPEEFRPEIAQNSEMFNGKYFLAFATQDKGSGIDRYEVLESKKRKIENRSWETAESPYVLQDQTLRSWIYVKAVDKAGNERIVAVEPRYPMRWYEQPLVWVIIILLAVIIRYIPWKIFNAKIKYQKSKWKIKNQK